MIRRISTVIVAMLTSLLLAGAVHGEPAAEKPNIVLILIDDLGWADLGCYGNSFNETPNIDRLAREGMRFTNAYSACCVCSPTRASIMTGKYPARLHLTDFIPGHPRPWAKLKVPHVNLQLPLEEITIAESLKPAGYVSAAIGKWHLGDRNFYPDKQGFDVSIVSQGSHIYPDFRTTPKIRCEKGDYLADVLTEQAVKFIKDNQGRPFFLYLAHFAVHIPLQAKQDLLARYSRKRPPHAGVNHPVYAAMVQSADESVGAITRRLDESGLADNTLVIFASDNGGLIKMFRGTGPVVTSNDPLRSEKGTQYEGGIRTPLIVRWPGKVTPGSTSDVPVSSIDFFPTILDATGIKLPADNPIDGESLVPELTQKGTLKRDALYWHYPHYHHNTPAGAVRQGDYKLIKRYEDGTLELYNLSKDIGERSNLAQRMPDKAAELSGKLDRWLRSVNAQMPTPNPGYDPARSHEWGRRTHYRPPSLPARTVLSPDSTGPLRCPDGSLAAAGPYIVNVSKSLLGKRGTVSLWFRPAHAICDHGKKLHLIDGEAFEVFIDPRRSETWVLLHSGSAMTGDSGGDKSPFYWFGAALTHLKARRWYHGAWSWDTKDPERNVFYLDGIAQGGRRRFDFDAQLRPADRDVDLKIGSTGLTVSAVTFWRQPLSEAQAMHLCEAADHSGYTTEGLRFDAEHFFPNDVDWEHPVYDTDFDDASVLSDWRLEGGQRMSVANGCLVLENGKESLKSEAKANHLVCWLTREVPADFLLEFSVRPQNRKSGLNIVFFNARGLNGENIFEPPIKPRTGVFKQYIHGDLNNYHISYWSGGRGTANLRKNKGFQLAAIGSDLLEDSHNNTFQTVRVYKRGGKIRLIVDDVVALAFDDDGKTYGPVHEHSGWIGLRQMAHTHSCEYAYVRVYPLEQG